MKTKRFNEIINLLKETGSTNSKKDILTNLIDTDYEFFRFLNKCYCSFSQFYLRKIETVEVENEREEIEEDFFELLSKLQNREITGNTAKDFVKSFLSNYDKETQQNLINVIKKNMNIGVSSTTINKVLPKKDKYQIEKFELQLAVGIDFNKHYKKRYFISRKLDGIRGIGFDYNDFEIIKRSGKTSVGLEHISADLAKLNEALKEKYDGLFFADGELYSDDIHFSEIQGTVSKITGNKKVIKLNIFAVETNKTKGAETIKNMEILNNDVKNLIEKLNLSSLTIVEQELVEFEKNSFKEHLKRINDKFVEEGYEGVMLKDPETPYEYKRCKSLLKYKDFFENDFTVTGYKEGEGEFVGTLGALYYEGIIDGKAISGNVGSGFKKEERDEIWKNPDAMIGKSIEIRYQNISNDSQGNFSLRFPRFRKIKEDR